MDENKVKYHEMSMFVTITTDSMHPLGVILFDRFIHLNTLYWVNDLHTLLLVLMYSVVDKDSISYLCN